MMGVKLRLILKGLNLSVMLLFWFLEIGIGNLLFVRKLVFLLEIVVRLGFVRV